jgi:VRR-NUC domain-containing protein
MISINPTESQIQCAIVEWANNNIIPHTKHKVGKFLVKFTNEGKRSWILGKKMKKEGLKKGVSDLFFAFPTYCYNYFEYKDFGLWIEVKSKKGKLSKEQKEWIELMIIVGYKAVVVYSVEEGIQAIKDYLGMK